MRKAVIYGRVSSEDKQDYSRQVSDLSRFAKLNKIQIVETFTEKISGTKKAEQRKEYTKMLEYLDTHSDVKLILCTELTRFGRLGTKTKLAIEDLAEKGICLYFQDRNLYSLDDKGKANSDTMMIIGILCDIAKKEIETLKQRIVSGLRYSVSNNGAGTGVLQPYGFKNVNKKRVIDVQESNVIKEIFDLYINGLGAASIAMHLNSLNIPTRYNKVFKEKEVKTKAGIIKKGTTFSWSENTIITILKNSIYKGERKFKNEIFKVEPIVDSITFDKVQQIIKKRTNRPINAIKNDNHLKGIIKCGVCGQPYYMHKRKDNRDNAYKCLSMKLKYEGKVKPCLSPSINIDKLLNSLYYLTSFMVMKNQKSKKSDLEISKQIKIKNKKIELENLKNETIKFDKRLIDLIDLLTDGTINKKQYQIKQLEYKAKLDSITKSYDSLITELIGLEKTINTHFNNKLNKDVFFNNVRDVIKLITISSFNPDIEISKRYTFKNDTLTKVSVETTNGISFQYLLSRYSDILVLLNNNKFMVEVKVESKFKEYNPSEIILRNGKKIELLA